MTQLALLQEELGKLPPDQQESWAGWFRYELAMQQADDRWFERLTPAEIDQLRKLVDEGIESGDAGPLDMDAIKREARTTWNARKQAP